MNIFDMIGRRAPLWDAAGGAGTGGAGDGNPPAGDEGQGQPPVSDPFAELDEATREWVKTRHDGDVGKLAKQAYELDKFAGKAIAMPGDDAAADDWDKFWSRLGRPESAEQYDLKVPENLPETLPYDEDLAKGFKSKAHELGLTQKQAAALHDFVAEYQVENVSKLTDQLGSSLQNDIDAANEAIRKEWGEPGSETYNANLEMAGRFFDAVDEKGNLAEVLSKRGLLGSDREVLVPELAFAFAKAGAAIFTEGATLSEGSDLNGANPFAGEGNLTAIMQLVKNDPDKAMALARAAGADPADYGLK